MTHLETYLDTLRLLPHEFHRHFALLSSLERKSIDTQIDCDVAEGATNDAFTNTIPIRIQQQQIENESDSNKATTAIPVDNVLNESILKGLIPSSNIKSGVESLRLVRRLQSSAHSLCSEKVSLAQQANSIIQSYLTRLEDDMTLFERECPEAMEKLKIQQITNAHHRQANNNNDERNSSINNDPQSSSSTNRKMNSQSSSFSSNQHSQQLLSSSGHHPTSYNQQSLSRSSAQQQKHRNKASSSNSTAAPVSRFLFHQYNDSMSQSAAAAAAAFNDPMNLSSQLHHSTIDDSTHLTQQAQHESNHQSDVDMAAFAFSSSPMIANNSSSSNQQQQLYSSSSMSNQRQLSHSQSSNIGSSSPALNAMAGISSSSNSNNQNHESQQQQSSSSEPIYCFCQQPSHGEMVGCDAVDCKYEWFHYDCVGLKKQPKGEWYCSACAPRQRQQQQQQV